MLTSVIKEINLCLNEEIYKVNIHFDKSNMIIPSIVAVIYFQKGTISINNTIFPKDIMQFFQSEILLQIIDEIILSMNKLHIVNTHILFKVIDALNPDMVIFELPETSLIFPKMNEVVSSLSNFFCRKISEENYVIEHLNEGEYEVDFSIFFHDFFEQGTFDLMIYKSRLLDFNNEFSEVYNYILKFLNENFGFEIVNGKNLISKKFEANISLLIIVNFTHFKDKNIDACCIKKILDCIRKEVEQKINTLANNSQLQLSFQTIKLSLERIHHVTNNMQLYDKLDNLLYSEKDIEGDEEKIFKKLYKNFIANMK